MVPAAKRPSTNEEVHEEGVEDCRVRSLDAEPIDVAACESTLLWRAVPHVGQ